MPDLSPREAFAGIVDCPERQRLIDAFDSVLDAVKDALPERSIARAEKLVFDLAGELSLELRDVLERKYL